MPRGEEGTLDALRCAACDCHRNFHRRQVEGEPSCDCQYFGRDKHRASSPIDLPGRVVTLPYPSSTMLGRPAAHTPLSTGISESEELDGSAYIRVANPSAIRKRFRTKFTAEQKGKMFSMAEKLGWRIQKLDEAEVQHFCSDVGVKRHVLKVWMHNNKQTLGKKL
ncbi:hypothetical protein O6H91_03G102300 [Diphasiastrum complanatum]|nr:hypothetical protein O6H91_03G102300 [Diphasiastrum complanatum]